MTAARPFEIGLFTFGEITADPVTDRPIDPAVRLREFIELLATEILPTVRRETASQPKVSVP